MDIHLKMVLKDLIK